MDATNINLKPYENCIIAFEYSISEDIKPLMFEADIKMLEICRNILEKSPNVSFGVVSHEGIDIFNTSGKSIISPLLCEKTTKDLRVATFGEIDALKASIFKMKITVNSRSLCHHWKNPWIKLPDIADFSDWINGIDTDSALPEGWNSQAALAHNQICYEWEKFKSKSLEIYNSKSIGIFMSGQEKDAGSVITILTKDVMKDLLTILIHVLIKKPF